MTKPTNNEAESTEDLREATEKAKQSLTVTKLRLANARKTLAAQPDADHLKDELKAAERAVETAYAAIKKCDRRQQHLAFAATDREAERAMLMDLNGISRDKTDAEFEQRVQIRKSQNMG